MTCVAYCEGMKFYGEALERMGFARYENGTPCLFLGLYFQADYDRLFNHCGRRFIFWNGSDVLRTIQNPAWHDQLRSSTITHACHNEQLRGELESIGVKATVEPTFFADEAEYAGRRRQAIGRPEFYMTSHPGRDAEYGVPEAVQMFARHPEAELHVFGGGDDFGGDNVTYHGTVGESEWDGLTDGMRGCVRLNRHDGLSQIVVKAILRGHYPVYDEPGLTKALAATEPNSEVVPRLNEWISKVRCV